MTEDRKKCRHDWKYDAHYYTTGKAVSLWYCPKCGKQATGQEADRDVES